MRFFISFFAGLYISLITLAIRLKTVQQVGMESTGKIWYQTSIITLIVFVATFIVFSLLIISAEKRGRYDYLDGEYKKQEGE